MLGKDNLVNRSNPFYTVSPKYINKGLELKNQNEIERGLSSSSIDSERGTPRVLSSPRVSLMLSIEKELRKVNVKTKINSHTDILTAVKLLVKNILQGILPCQSCKDRIETIEKLTSNIQSQKLAALEEIEKIREMKAQVKKFENLLKNKEKNLELERSNLVEKNDLLEKKLKIVEESSKNLETEKNKFKEEKKKLDEEKTLFVKKFKKLDDQFLNTNKEIQYRESTDAFEAIQREKIVMAVRNEILSTFSTEADSKNKSVLEVAEKFTEMKGRLEENHKNLERIIQEQLISSKSKEASTKAKFKKLKLRLSNFEGKLKQIAMKQPDQSSIKEENTEHFDHLNLIKPEQEEKDAKLLEYKKRCEKLEESLLKKQLELQELSTLPSDVSEKARQNEIKEKELLDLQFNLDQEKTEIAKTAEMLQELYLQLEIQQNTLNLEKQLVENEKQTNEKFFEKETRGHGGKKMKNSKDKEKILEQEDLPEFQFKQSLHFSDDDMVIRINK